MKSNEDEKLREKFIKLLRDSVGIACEKEKKVGIFLSGGLDSTLITFLAKEFSNEVIAYTIGYENSKDLEYVYKLMREMGDSNVKFKVKKINVLNVKKNLKEILEILDEKQRINPIQVSCAIPIYFASKEAKSDSLRVMLSGQGGDELFGGYNRYLNYLLKFGYQKLKKILEEDVRNAYQDNLERDVKVSASQGIKLKFPFMNEKIVRFALKIPIKLKIKEVLGDEKFSCIDIINGKKFIRKYLLRKIAEDLNVPEFIINRSKKALQYGSGSWKILEKISREEGFKGKNNIYLYLEDLTKKIF